MVAVTWRGSEGSRFNLTLTDGTVLAFEPGQEVLIEELPAEFQALSRGARADFDVRPVQVEGLPAEPAPPANPAPDPEAAGPPTEGGEVS